MRLTIAAALLLVTSVTPNVASAAIAPGTLVITDHALDPQSGTFEKDLKRAAKTSLTKGDGDVWHVYFVAYMRSAPNAEVVNVVFYDVTGGKREQVNAFEINTQARAKIIMSDLEVKAEQGFVAGHKYQVLVTRLIGGKEEVYARANLELK